MSIKRKYKIKEIYYLTTRGFSFFVENSLHLAVNFADRKMKLLANGQILAVKLKGIETLCGKEAHHKISLLLSTLNEDDKELMDFLGINKRKCHLQNIENIHLEIEFFEKDYIQKI